MGRYYALHEILPTPVADAIAEHYAPQGPSDRCPSAPVSVAVALADRIDTLVGFWAIDEKPSGSRDPYALRRAALSTIRLIVENNLSFALFGALVLSGRFVMAGMLGNARGEFASKIRFLSEFKDDSVIKRLVEVSGDAVTALKVTDIANVPPAKWESDRATSLLDFFADRLKVQVRERGVRHDLVDAVFALGGEDDLVRLLARVEALQAFVGTEDGRNLLVAYNRAANIVRAEEKKDKALSRRIDGEVDAALLLAPEEKAVADALSRADARAGAALDAEDFTAAMTALAELRAPIDVFFDRVTVNVDERDLRLNRLRLLNRIRTTINRVADFSRIEG
jgi:glycyl-tRNA synthetase beta chain